MLGRWPLEKFNNLTKKGRRLGETLPSANLHSRENDWTEILNPSNVGIRSTINFKAERSDPLTAHKLLLCELFGFSDRFLHSSNRNGFANSSRDFSASICSRSF